jgi:hypothetical protein
MNEKFMKKIVRSLGCELFFFIIFSSMGDAGVQFEYKILTLAT